MPNIELQLTNHSFSKKNTGNAIPVIEEACVLTVLLLDRTYRFHSLIVALVLNLRTAETGVWRSPCENQQLGDGPLATGTSTLY